MKERPILFTGEMVTHRKLLMEVNTEQHKGENISFEINDARISNVPCLSG